jgi:hypothetical protein
VISADLDVSSARAYPVLADLGSYADWMDLVHRVDSAEAVDSDAGPAWFVTLRAKVGPLARSKRLRMVRTEGTLNETVSTVRFQRAETDGRDHSEWTMTAIIEEGSVTDSCHVDVELRYEGGLWSNALDMLLGSSVDDAVDGLRRRVHQAK